MVAMTPEASTETVNQRSMDGQCLAGGGLTRLEDPIKPATDEQDYRVVRLPNGMRVMLVHDPAADKAAAAVDVCLVLRARIQQCEHMRLSYYLKGLFSS